MKKRILFVIIALLLVCGALYAANGDLIVNGNLGIGAPPSGTNKVDIVSDRSSRSIIFTYYNNDTGPVAFSGRKARGSLSAPSHVIAGDGLITINGNGYGDTQFSGTPGRIAISAAEGFTDASHPTFMTFGTASSGSVSQTERMRIDSTGYVGIGTTAPNAKLHVAGNVKLGSGSVYANKLLCWTGSGTIGFCDVMGSDGTCSSCKEIN